MLVYTNNFGHKPSFHGGSIEKDGLAAKLNSIRNKYKNSSDPNAKSQMIKDIKTLYLSPEFKSMNMWPVTRDWLKQHAADSNLIPD